MNPINKSKTKTRPQERPGYPTCHPRNGVFSRGNNHGLDLLQACSKRKSGSIIKSIATLLYITIARRGP